MQPVLVDLEEADLPLSLPVRKEAHEHLMFEAPLLLVEVKGPTIGDVAAASLRILVGRCSKHVAAIERIALSTAELN